MRIATGIVLLLGVSLLLAGGAGAGFSCDCRGPGNEDAVWLPDGKGIGYAGNSATNSRDIFIRTSDGETRQLTHGAAILFNDAHRPFAFSPDAATLAFVDSDLQLIDVATATVTRHVPADFSPVAFSPDGRELAFEHRGLWALDVGTGATRLVAPVGHDPAWHGAALAYDDGNSVYVSDGSTVRGVAAGTRPVWSPDGQWIAYERGGSIWAKRLADETEHEIGRGALPRWLPDGRAIVFGGAFGEIETVDPAGVSPRVLYNSEQRDAAPVPSPDGSQIAFVSYRAGESTPVIDHPDLYVVPAAGGKRAALVDGCGITAAAPEQTICLRAGAQSIPASIAVAPRLLVTWANASKGGRVVVLGGYVLDHDGRPVRGSELFTEYGTSPRQYSTARTLTNGRFVLELGRASGPRLRSSVAVAISAGTGDDAWVTLRVPRKSFR